MNQTIYPIGIQNFEKIRKDGYLYIDKTALVYQLVTTGQYYFLSRPRRFGKSLLLSTLEAYFQGKKELFEGLAMEKLEKDWKEYPILHFDLNISQYDSPDSLYKILNDILSRYEDEVKELADTQMTTYEETCLKLKQRYDGYHFTAKSEGIYNPFSLLNTFAKMEFGDYWFETGTPSYLVELLKHTHYDLYEMANTETDADVLNSIDSASNNPIPVIYQSGYLTIKGYDPEFGIYRLGFPNKEVEEGFVKYLLPFYTSIQASKTPFEIGQFVREIRSGNYDAFFHRLQSFFADTPYEVIAGQKPERDTELHYRNVLFIVFKLVGLYTQVEYHTSNGRIDLVLQTDRYVYIMEFKLNGTAEEALRQIEEKGYALPFAGDDREVFKIGVNFSSETRNIEKWLVG